MWKTNLQRILFSFPSFLLNCLRPFLQKRLCGQVYLQDVKWRISSSTRSKFEQKENNCNALTKSSAIPRTAQELNFLNWGGSLYLFPASAPNPLIGPSIKVSCPMWAEQGRQWMCSAFGWGECLIPKWGSGWWSTGCSAPWLLGFCIISQEKMRYKSKEMTLHWENFSFAWHLSWKMYLNRFFLKFLPPLSQNLILEFKITFTRYEKKTSWGIYWQSSDIKPHILYTSLRVYCMNKSYCEHNCYWLYNKVAYYVLTIKPNFDN